MIPNGRHTHTVPRTCSRSLKWHTTGRPAVPDTASGETDEKVVSALRTGGAMSGRDLLLAVESVTAADVIDAAVRMVLSRRLRVDERHRFTLRGTDS